MNLKLYFCAMEINDALIDKLAMLSRLSFSGGEKSELKINLQKMIGFIDKLNELDTSGVKPRLHINDNVNVLREDVVVQNITREDALFNSPVKDTAFFKVPKVINK